MGESPRTRRLRNDLRIMEELRADSSILDFSVPPMQSQTPDSYVIKFRGRGLWRDESGNIVVREVHEVFIKLGAAYPRGTPELAWRSPIFHPNISAGGAVCLGGYGTHWTPSLMLDELCTMLWDMIRYANFDVESPYNREAAHWAKTQSRYSLPVDPRPIRDQLAGIQENLDAPAVMPHGIDTPGVTERSVTGLDAAVVPAHATDGPSVSPPVRQAEQPDVLFLSDGDATEEVVEAELIDGDRPEDPDILFID